jgi:hypothetical protein
MKAFLARALVLVLPCAAIAQVAILQIKVVEGEGAVHPAGAHISRPLMVEVTDETGKPVAGAAVSFQLPADGPGGLFANGLRTDLVVTDARGQAVLRALQLNHTAGQFRIRITAVKEQARAGTVSEQYIAEAHSAGITQNTTKMGSGVSKKWIVLGALAVAGGVAALAVTHASHSGNSTVSSSVVSIGTPVITVGNPNQ